MPEALSSDDLLDHERDRRDEPEAHRQDNQQESSEEPRLSQRRCRGRLAGHSRAGTSSSGRRVL